MVVDEDSQKYLTINTQQGLFTFQRLPFGLVSAPTIFQKNNGGIGAGNSQSSHLSGRYLDKRRGYCRPLREPGGSAAKAERCRVETQKREKCVFLQDDIEYLGHRVNVHSVQTVGRKVKAIVEAPSPSNVS